MVLVIWCDQKRFGPVTFPVQAAEDWFFLIAQAAWSLMLKISLRKSHSAEFCCELCTVDMYLLIFLFVYREILCRISTYLQYP